MKGRGPNFEAGSARLATCRQAIALIGEARASNFEDDPVGARRVRVLVFVNHYLPGFRGGGALRSIVNLVDSLGDEIDFRIVTSDRDLGESKGYQGVLVDGWQQVGKARVFYSSAKLQRFCGILRLLRERSYDVLYINSAFHPVFAVLPLAIRRLGLVRGVATIVAPKGEFSPGALRIRKGKKELFLTLSRSIGLYRGVIWQVTDGLERGDLIAALGMGGSRDAVKVVEARDIVLARGGEATRSVRGKEPGRLRAVFLSRIAPKKNLLGAVSMLKDLQGDVSLCVFGPIEDKEYWSLCEAAIRLLPRNVVVRYRGEVEPAGVRRMFEDHDLFLFPTHGENFGHVIHEALVAGCPVLTSTATPWRDLEKVGAGWDVPLEDGERFKKVLQRCVDMGTKEHALVRSSAAAFAREKLEDPSVLTANRMLFRTAVTSGKD